MDGLSWATTSYIAEHRLAHVAVHDVDWLRWLTCVLNLNAAFLIGRGPVVKCLGVLKCKAWFYMHLEPYTRLSSFFLKQFLYL